MSESLVATTLREAADHIESAGWTTGQLYDMSPWEVSQKQLDEAPSCASGAIGWASGMYFVDIEGRLRNRTKSESPLRYEVVSNANELALKYLRRVRGYGGASLVTWNDERAEWSGEVIALLRDVAKWVEAGKHLDPPEGSSHG